MILIVLRYFPVARAFPRHTKPKRRAWKRPVLTLLGAAFIVGGLVKLAVDDTVADVATADLGAGPTRAASSESEPDTDDDGADEMDPLNAALVSMLADER